MIRNTTNTLKVFAFNHNTAHPQTGDAANITCKVSLNGGARNALADTNPVELEDGYYLFDVTAAESNGVTADFFPESSTNNIQVICVEHNRYLIPEGGAATLANQNTIISAIDSISVPTVIGTVVTRNQQTTLTAFVGETYTFTIATVDADGNPVDCSALALEVVIEQLDRTDLVVIPNGSISKTSTTVAFAVSSTYHASEAQYRWALRRTDTNVVIMHGPYVVSYAADN